MPRYHRIYLVLRQKIISGIFDKSGLPTEFELMEQYRAARVTVRRALSELSDEGLIIRRRGQGTFVNLEHVRRTAAPPRMHGLLDSLLEAAANTSVRLVAFGVGPCPPPVRAALRLDQREEALHVRRVRVHEGKPVSLLDAWVPPHVAALLSPGVLQQPMLTLMEAGGIRIGEADQTLSCCLADAPVAELLEEPVGAPLLSVVRVVRDVDGNPVQWLSGLYRPQCYDYRMALTRAGEDSARIWIARDLATDMR